MFPSFIIHIFIFVSSPFLSGLQFLMKVSARKIPLRRSFHDICLRGGTCYKTKKELRFSLYHFCQTMQRTFRRSISKHQSIPCQSIAFQRIESDPVHPAFITCFKQNTDLRRCASSLPSLEENGNPRRRLSIRIPRRTRVRRRKKRCFRLGSRRGFRELLFQPPPLLLF